MLSSIVTRKSRKLPGTAEVAVRPAAACDARCVVVGCVVVLLACAVASLPQPAAPASAATAAAAAAALRRRLLICSTRGGEI